MTDHTHTYLDLVNVEDWLNAKGYTGEAGACHQAMSLIRSQEKRIAELEAALKKIDDELAYPGIFDRLIKKLENHEDSKDTDAWMSCGDAAKALKEVESSLKILRLQRDGWRDGYFERRGKTDAARAALEKKNDHT